LLTLIKQPEPWGFKVTLFCPECKTRLFYQGDKRYETLVEHGFDPIATPPYRPYFVCVNDSCPRFLKSGIFYGIDGGQYGGEYGKVIKDAIGSISWKVEKALQKQKRKKKESSIHEPNR
jgi:hypothetical protein